jgi:HSP20 family protein
MALIRFGDRQELRNPWTEFERIRQGMDKLSQGYYSREFPFGSATVFPALNVFEDREHVIIKAELPGVEAEYLTISLEGETLTVKGKREAKHNGEKLSYHRREIEAGNFSRAINLPIKVNPETVTARLTNGILTITMEKAAEVKPRQVTVTTE